jgi:hypothetical protein
MIQDLQKLDRDYETVQQSVKKVDEIIEAMKKEGRGREFSEKFLSDKVWIGKESLRTWRKIVRIDIEKADSDDVQEILSPWNFNQDIECLHGEWMSASASQYEHELHVSSFNARKDISLIY